MNMEYNTRMLNLSSDCLYACFKTSFKAVYFIAEKECFQHIDEDANYRSFTYLHGGDCVTYA